MATTTKTKIHLAMGMVATLFALSLVWYFRVLHQPAGIHAPIAAVNMPYDTINFKAEEGVEIHYKTGSVITIPPNALVTGDGNPAKGNVSAVYREFHNADDIFKAGIPMGDVGQGGALMSGGMFELMVLQDDEVLNLASGKRAGVSLAAYRSTEGYSVYSFSSDGAWEKRGLPQLDTNIAKRNGLAALKPLPPKPIDPRVGEEDIIIDLEANYYTNPDLAFFKNTRWRLVPDENESISENAWAFRVIWDAMKITPFDQGRNLYKLEMKQRQQTYGGKAVQRNFEVVVAPVLEGADLDASLAKFTLAMQQYDSAAIYVLQEKERLEKEADMLNTFEIERFGLHNIDQEIKNGVMLAIHADFDFLDHINPYFTKVRVYFLNYTLNTVQSYGVQEWGQVYIQPNSNTTVLATLPGNKVAILKGDEFAKLNLASAVGHEQIYRFKMQVVQQEQLFPMVQVITASR